MKAYKKAGVDLAAADEAVQKLKPLAKRTLRPEVMSGLGGFGGLFSLEKSGYKNPVLVSGTDGVGTKLKLAFELDRHDSIGIDLVAMCVNDILVQGAEPLFFLDYLACGKLLPEQVESIVGGISEGCIQSGAALLGGETAEMPGMYEDEEYDLAGFAVGVVEKEKLIDGSRIEAGDVDQFIDTGSYMFNALVSGSLYGGLPSNKIIAFAGETSTGKTYFVMGVVKKFLDDNPDGAVFYFESESVAETAEKKAKKILEEEGQSVYRIGQIVSGNKTEVCWR